MLAAVGLPEGWDTTLCRVSLHRKTKEQHMRYIKTLGFRLFLEREGKKRGREGKKKGLSSFLYVFWDTERHVLVADTVHMTDIGREHSVFAIYIQTNGSHTPENGSSCHKQTQTVKRSLPFFVCGMDTLVWRYSVISA